MMSQTNSNTASQINSKSIKTMTSPRSDQEIQFVNLNSSSSPSSTQISVENGRKDHLLHHELSNIDEKIQDEHNVNKGDESQQRSPQIPVITSDSVTTSNRLSNVISRFTQPPPSFYINIEQTSTDLQKNVKISLPAGNTNTSNENKVIHTNNEVMYTTYLSNQALHSAASYHRYYPSVPPSNLPWFLQWPMFFTGYIADSHVQLGTAIIYLVLSIIGMIWRNSPWFWYIVAGMTADAGFRAVGGDRLSVLSCLAEMVTTFIPGSYKIASAPRQFTAIFFTIWNLICVMLTGFISDADSNHVSLATLLGIEALMQLFEVFSISFPALFFERVLVRSGVITDEYLHKAEHIMSEQKLKQCVGQAKVAHSGIAHTVVVTHNTGEVLMRFKGLVLAARTGFDPIKNCTTAYCFPLLAMAGLTDLFYYGTLMVGLNSYAWKVLAVVLLVSYFSFYSIQLARLYFVPQMLFREFKHPHLRYSFLIMLNVPLLSTDFMADVSETYCKVVLWVCGPLLGIIVLLFIKDWIEQPMSFELVNASWLIAAISLIIVAFEIPLIYPDLSELAWLWLAFGIFMWVLLVAFIFVRLFFTPPLPDAQRATLFLLISTGAISTAAVLFQDSQVSSEFLGPYSTLAEFLHWITTFLALICYTLLLNAYFCRSPFNMSYWGIAFPSSALALVWLFYWKIGRCNLAFAPSQYSSEERCTDNETSNTLQGIVILLFVNASVSNAILAVNTVLAFLQRRLFTPMPRWSPAAAVQLQHLAFRTALYRAGTIIKNLSSTKQVAEPSSISPSSSYLSKYHQSPLGIQQNCPCSECIKRDPKSTETSIENLIEILSLLDLSLQTYMIVKQSVLWPSVQLWIPEIQLNHLETKDMSLISSRLEKIRFNISTIGTDIQQNTEILLRSQQDLTSISQIIHHHLDHEEIFLTPLIHHFTDVPAVNILMKKIWESVDIHTWRVVLPWLIDTIPDHPQRLALIDCFNWSIQEVQLMLGRWLSHSIDPFLYAQLCVDYPHLKSKDSSYYSKFW